MDGALLGEGIESTVFVHHQVGIGTLFKDDNEHGYGSEKQKKPLLGRNAYVILKRWKKIPKNLI